MAVPGPEVLENLDQLITAVTGFTVSVQLIFFPKIHNDFFRITKKTSNHAEDIASHTLFIMFMRPLINLLCARQLTIWRIGFTPMGILICLVRCAPKLINFFLMRIPSKPTLRYS